MEKLDHKNSERNSGMELLRILAILMIISVHYLDASGGGILAQPFSPSFNILSARALESFAIIGVNLFVLITGYFGCTSRGLNLRRFVNLILVVAFWGLLLFFHDLSAGTPFSFALLARSLFPYMFGSLWYCRVYFILLFIAPFLNILISDLTKRGLCSVTAVLMVLFSLLPSFVPAFENAAGYDIISFVMLYFIGATVRLSIDKKPSKLLSVLLYFVCSAVTAVFSIYGDGLSYWGYDFISCVLASVFLFLAFCQINFRSRFINYLGKMTFGIYILNVSFPNLYTKFVVREDYFTSKYFIVHFLVCVFGFFIVGTVCETIRTGIFRFTVDPLLDKIPFVNKRLFTKIGKQHSTMN